MADTSRNTEKPTPKRLEKARKEGQFPVSREFVSSLVFAFAVWMLHRRAEDAVGAGKQVFTVLLADAFRGELSLRFINALPQTLVLLEFRSLLMVGGALSAAGLAVHLVTTGLGVAWGKAAPDFTRLNPIPRLSSLWTQNLGAAIKATLLIPLFFYILYRLIAEYWADFETLSRMPPLQALRVVANSTDDLLTKSAAVLFVLGCFDLFRQRQKWTAMMRMSKQQIREEHKESEGNPMIRMRIRRLQREALKRRMMQQVPQATAVVVNPTHYAVAVQYRMQEMSAPRVVAKGKNWLALRIREVATKHNVPIVENAPLAQALYGSVQVGQEIPLNLYQAVAEVLAYIFRLGRRQSFRSGSEG